MKYIYLQLLLLLFFILRIPAANSYTVEEEQWLNSDNKSDVSQVNEGELEFIIQPQKKRIFHSVNNLNIRPESIEDGWVDLQQCYYNLDKIDNVEITYKYQSMKELMLVSKKNIESAVVAKQSVQLREVKDNAEICVSTEVRILYKNKNSSFSLINGPYHRRFLDGYYPYHVSLIINYPEHLLSFISSTPKIQDGFSITKENNKLIIDTYFEGILNTEIIFELK